MMGRSVSISTNTAASVKVLYKLCTMRSDYNELVWKDLCGRLPYGVRCYVPTHDEVMRLTGQRLNYLCFHKDSFGLDYSHEIETVLDPWNSDIIVRPYLRPLSSMTKKEKKEYANLEEYNYVQAVDWMYEHHFDCRGLIEKGLAYEAPKNMYAKRKRI